MKKIILLVAVTGFLFTACQKEEEGTSPASTSPLRNAPATVQAISPVPGLFVKKILAEEFVGAPVGLTPDASFDLSKVVKQYPNTVYSASLHVFDLMTSNASSTAIKTLTTQTLTYPCGVVNRKPFNGNLFIDSKQFQNAVQTLLNNPVKCGVAISTHINGATATVDIHAGFASTISGTYLITAYLIEDGIINTNPDFDQDNTLNNIMGSAFYHAGNPIHNYEHKNVARSIIGPLTGQAINAINMVAGGVEIFNYSIDIPQKMSSVSTFKVIAFITDSNTNEVVNVQECILGQEKDWN